MERKGGGGGETLKKVRRGFQLSVSLLRGKNELRLMSPQPVAHVFPFHLSHSLVHLHVKVFFCLLCFIFLCDCNLLIDAIISEIMYLKQHLSMKSYIYIFNRRK